MDSFGASRGRRKKRLGDLLIEGGLINDEQLQQALQAQKESDVRQKLGTVLIDLGFASDDDIAEVLSRQLNLTKVRLADYHIEDNVLTLVDEKLLRKYMLMPYEFDPENPNVLRVAMSDPMDLGALDDLSIVCLLYTSDAADD